MTFARFLELLGYKDDATTMINTHVLYRLGILVRNPLDQSSHSLSWDSSAGSNS